MTAHAMHGSWADRLDLADILRQARRHLRAHGTQAAYSAHGSHGDHGEYDDGDEGAHGEYGPHEGRGRGRYRGHRRRGGFDRPFGPGGPFGSGGPFGPGGPFGDFGRWGRQGFGPFGGGPRARRGDVRAAALALLAERPMNGYQIIQEIRERSGGMWKPSSGSVYPALQQLEDEGLIVAGEHEGRRAFSLTEQGREYVTANAEELKAPWSAFDSSAGEQVIEIKALVGQAVTAFMQVMTTGTPEQVDQAKQVLNDARKAFYRILAEDESPADQE